MANVTTIIALVVLVLFAIVYLTLFIMLGKAKKMTITAKLEDDFVLKIMIKDYIAMEKEGFLKGFKAYYQKRKKQNQTSDAVLTAITTFIILLFVVLMSFSLIFKANDQLIYFGNTTYLVVRTNSMENISNVNEYVEENELFNQIKPNSLIVIEKKDTYDLYDVCAFKVEDEIIVHRIIKIEYDKDGNKYYTFRGDANPGSMTFETYVSEDEILGYYTGECNELIGNVVVYFQSGIGIFSVGLSVIVTSVYFTYYNKILALYDVRYLDLIDQFLLGKNDIFNPKRRIRRKKKHLDNFDDTKPIKHIILRKVK